ncbi:PEP/pyruvate-binding domain-containing protein [Streptomyces sp. NPDC059349]|uniref:PEP/pyruvate-binding domain-containing protein n=1 Tax=Streptomyces sp. NPDC059349 TaxID=3346808 RepID=UPI00369D7B4D
MATTRCVIPFAELGRQDVGRVGGKNASLGEMTAHLAAAGVRVPPGFATTADAYGELLGGHGREGASTSNSDGCTKARHWKRWGRRSAR